MTNWTVADIPTQSGKLAIVTSSTGGLGFETAPVLAQTGAEVLVTGRNDAKGRDAVAKIRSRIPGAKISYEALDLASLASVTDFAKRFATGHSSLDLLINNAGVMALPTRQTTADGFEMQFGTNHLGHYALTAQLLPLLRRGHEPRVVNLSSIARRETMARNVTTMTRTYRTYSATLLGDYFDIRGQQTRHPDIYASDRYDASQKLGEEA